jgi:histidinol-phosphatase
VEQAIRAELASSRPDDAVLGEEDGETGTGPRRWVVDPVDGTKNFVRGVPVWASLIALQQDGVVTVGVVSAPALGPALVGRPGAGCVLRWSPRRRPTPAGQRSVVARRRLAGVLLAHLGWEEQGRLPGAAAAVARRLADPGLRRLLVARAGGRGGGGRLFEPEVSLWDLAPLQVVVEEAGGRFTDLGGASRPDGGSAVCSNGLLHDRVLAALHPGSAARG